MGRLSDVLLAAAVVIAKVPLRFDDGNANDNAIFEVLTTTQARSSKSLSLPLHENHSYQGSEIAVRLFCTT